MHTDRWRRIEEIYHQALEVPLPERQAFLSQTCQGDTALRQDIESLLELQAGAADFLEQPALEAAAKTLAAGVPALRPPQIPGYRTIRELGEGGMGLVYLAEQERPLRRLVALKLIRPGMDSRQIVARFNAERQALALMDHPNIAAVFDAGSTADGVPYFVMEFVDGVPITEYCDRARLSMRARLGLFIDVCTAVQHAHQKGVLHRDLKPSNVLVAGQDGRAVPKVIDFGTAKAIEGSWGGGASLTSQGMVLGTIEYMSPEQAAFSRDIDTATDVYSLGVMLYELLVGVLPFEPPRPGPEGYDELRRLIRESDPPKPSTRLADVTSARTGAAIARHMDPDRLSRSLKGDLDWITLKALEKDRTRRYATVAALAADIQRFLADQPVDARPPSATYRLRKFTRRHRGGVAAASALILVLAGGLIATTAMYLRADRAVAEADRHRTSAELQRTLAERARMAAEHATIEAEAQRQTANEQRRLATEQAQRAAAALNDSEYRNYVITIGAADAELRDGQAAQAHARLLTVPVARRGWEWDHLFLRTDSSLFTLADARPCATSSLPGRNRLVAAREPNRMFASHCQRLLRLDTLTGEHTVAIPPTDATFVAVSASGRRLVTSQAPRGWQIALVDRLDDQTLRVIAAENRPAVCGDFSPDGTLVAAGLVPFPPKPGAPREDVFVLWNVDTGVRLGQWHQPVPTPDARSGSGDGTCSVRFSPDGSLLATSGATLQVRDIRSGVERFVDKGLAGVVGQPIAFSSDGTRLAVGRRNGMVDIVDLTSGTLVPLDGGQFLRPLPLAANSVDFLLLRARSDEDARALAYTPDGRFVVSAFSNRIALWDVSAGRMTGVLDGHISPIAEVTVGSNGLVYSLDHQGAVRAWHVDGSTGITRLEPTSPAVVRVGIARDGNTIVVSGADGSLDVWRSGGRQPLRLKPPNRPEQRETGNVVFPSSDGRFVVTSPWTEGDTSLARWSIDSRNRVETLPSTLFEPGCGVLGRTTWASLSFDDRYLAYGHAGCVVVRDLSTSRTVAKLNLAAAMGRDPALSSRRQNLVDDSVVANDIQFRPDGLLLVAAVYHVKMAAHSRAVMVWDWRANRVLSAHTQAAVPAFGPPEWAVSADGRRVALAGFTPNAVSIWDAGLTREVSRIPISTSASIAFSPDGRRIATAHPRDGAAVRVWDTETGQLLLTLADVDSHSRDIAFTSDGRLMAGLVSGGITIWETRKPMCATCPTKLTLRR